MSTTPSSDTSIHRAVAALGSGPFNASALKTHVWPLFSRTLSQQGTQIDLGNHSLGRPLDRTADDITRGLSSWYADPVSAWSAWHATQTHVNALIAQLIHAPDGDCILPKSSAGQGLRAVLNALEPTSGAALRVVSTQDEFDSLDFILRVYQQRGRIHLTQIAPRDAHRADARYVVEDLIAGMRAGTDLVVLSSVLFRTAQVLPQLAAVIAHAQQHGAKVLIDTYHHAGALPLDVQALRADFAVGGAYKYLRGGPGACWLYVHKNHHALRTLDTGWYAKADRLANQRTETPTFAAGGQAWHESTPAMLPAYQSLAGLEFTLAMGVSRLRTYNTQQQQRLVGLFKESGLNARGGQADHGAFVTLHHAQASAFAQSMQQRGVRCDARGDIVRFGPSILTSDAALSTVAHIAQAVQRSL